MSVTIEHMNKLAEKISELRMKEQEAHQVKKAISEELEAMENEMVACLTENGLQNYRSPHGLASVSFRTSVKTPKTQEQRQAFFDYLKEVGVYDRLITVNSQSLNSFYKEQFDLARERGDEDFKIPGLDEITVNPVLSFTRPR